MHLSPSQLALNVQLALRPRKGRRQLGPWQRVGLLLGNKPEMFWLKKEAAVKAMPPLHAKGPFSPRSFPEPSLAEARPEASKAARTGPWLCSWTWWDLSGKQLNSGLFCCIFFSNSVTSQFKKCITKAHQKRAAVLCPSLCCLGRSCIAKFVQKCDSEKSQGRSSISSRALADSDVKQGAKGLSPAAWDLQGKHSFWIFCK